MGILNRAFNIAKTKINISNISNNTFFDSNLEYTDYDDDLKKIIEELNSEDFHISSSSFDSENYSDKKNNIPIEVLEAYEIIEANVGDSTEKIKAKFKIAIKKYHPDALANKVNLSEAERKKADENAVKILNAYKIIINYIGI